MNVDRGKAPFYTRTLYRSVAGGFGLFLVGVGVYVLFLIGDATFLQLLIGLVLVLVGFNAVVSACRASESWLSRIGPLP